MKRGPRGEIIAGRNRETDKFHYRRFVEFLQRWL